MEKNISKKRVPIKRNNKFFGDSEFQMELEFMEEYMEQDANQNIILYQVDLEKTQTNDIYNETNKDKIRFKPPVELPVIYEIENSEMKAYVSNSNKGIYSKIGKLKFSILIKTLEENECDINRGDYIGIQITPTNRLYWTVVDDGKSLSVSNSFTLYGSKPFARTIYCAFVDKNEFNG